MQGCVLSSGPARVRILPACFSDLVCGTALHNHCEDMFLQQGVRVFPHASAIRRLGFQRGPFLVACSQKSAKSCAILQYHHESQFRLIVEQYSRPPAFQKGLSARRLVVDDDDGFRVSDSSDIFITASKNAEASFFGNERGFNIQLFRRILSGVST